MDTTKILLSVIVTLSLMSPCAPECTHYYLMLLESLSTVDGAVQPVIKPISLSTISSEYASFNTTSTFKTLAKHKDCILEFKDLDTCKSVTKCSKPFSLETTTIPGPEPTELLGTDSSSTTPYTEPTTLYTEPTIPSLVTDNGSTTPETEPTTPYIEPTIPSLVTDNGSTTPETEPTTPYIEPTIPSLVTDNGSTTPYTEPTTLYTEPTIPSLVTDNGSTTPYTEPTTPYIEPTIPSLVTDNGSTTTETEPTEPTTEADHGSTTSGTETESTITTGSDITGDANSIAKLINQDTGDKEIAKIVAICVVVSVVSAGLIYLLCLKINHAMQYGSYHLPEDLNPI